MKLLALFALAPSATFASVWKFNDAVVGELKTCGLTEQFCVSRCHGYSTKLTSCCANGAWTLNKEQEECAEGIPCDQVTYDEASCEAPFKGGHHPQRKAFDLRSFKAPDMTEMPDDLRVVFLGDGDTDRSSSYSVYAAAAAWKPDFVLYNADLDYRSSTGNPEEFIAKFDEYFGADMPMFATIGNHDTRHWYEGQMTGKGKAWETVLAERYARLGLSQFCEGTIGLNNACFYKGLYFLESGIGESTGRDDADQLAFLESSLAAHADYPWKACLWHKNQRLLQLCTKSDEVGYEAYEVCRGYGAMINNAHEHSYCRTHTLNEISGSNSIVVDDFSNDVTLGYNKTFVFVQGLAGSSVRNECSNLGSNEWMASWAAGNGNKGNVGQSPSKSSSYGFMGCVFKPNGVANKAECFFEDVNGEVFDRYTITSELA